MTADASRSYERVVKPSRAEDTPIRTKVILP